MLLGKNISTSASLQISSAHNGVVLRQLLSVFPDDIRSCTAGIPTDADYLAEDLMQMARAYAAVRSDAGYRQKLENLVEIIRSNYRTIPSDADTLWLRALIVDGLVDILSPQLPAELKAEADCLVRDFLRNLHDIHDYASAECQLTILALIQKCDSGENAYVAQVTRQWQQELTPQGCWKTSEADLMFRQDGLLHVDLSLGRLMILKGNAEEKAKAYYRTHIPHELYSWGRTAERMQQVYADDSALQESIVAAIATDSGLDWNALRQGTPLTTSQLQDLSYDCASFLIQYFANNDFATHIH
jgi:hypothetical protein